MKRRDFSSSFIPYGNASTVRAATDVDSGAGEIFGPVERDGFSCSCATTIFDEGAEDWTGQKISGNDSDLKYARVPPEKACGVPVLLLRPESSDMLGSVTYTLNIFGALGRILRSATGTLAPTFHGYNAFGKRSAHSSLADEATALNSCIIET